MNRTFEKAQELANRFSGEAKPFADLQHALSEADILISSTGANDYVVTKRMMSEAERTRKGRPLFMVDIAVPRDLDPELDELETVFLYDIDDLNGIVESNLQERQKLRMKLKLCLKLKLLLSSLGLVH